MYVSKKWIGKRAYPIFLCSNYPSSLHFPLLFSLSTLHFLLYSNSKLLPVFARYTTIVLLEAFIEIALIHKADFETNLCDRIFSFEDKICGNTHFLVHKVLVWTNAQNLFHSTVELRVAHLH